MLSKIRGRRAPWKMELTGKYLYRRWDLNEVKMDQILYRGTRRLFCKYIFQIYLSIFESLDQLGRSNAYIPRGNGKYVGTT